MSKTIKHFLDGKWNLNFTMPDDEKVINTTADVPGNIEPVLVKLGFIDDYMPADSEFATAEFEAVDDWCYTTCFDADKVRQNSIKQLVFEGIDTIADIYLNGECICNCNNMHIAYRIDVTDKLKEKNNTLKVVIRSSELWAREHCHDAFVTTHGDVSYHDSRSYLRKARHQWGWDNAPRLLTSGIFRSVYIEELSPERFEDIYFYTVSIDNESVKLGTDWIYRTDKKSLLNHKIKLSLLDKDKVVYEETKDVRFIQGSHKYSIPTDKIKLWWPVGFGEPYLYTLKLEMYDRDTVTACYEAPFGIRTLRLEHSEDVLEDGTGEFVFRINGEKVYIRGTNWKPLDPLASIADIKTKEGRALDEIKKLNCNMVRIWGGGIYEDESFFEYCDRNGIMVWQDFMFACEVPPTDEWYCRLVEKEAIYVIKKYRNHASLATWCGDNENDESMTWSAYHSMIRPSDSIVTRKVLKNAVLHFDPYRTYVSSSPYASDTNYMQRKSKMTHFQPETHLYPETVSFSESLRKCKSLFIGETGPIGVNAIAVNKKTFEREKERAKRLWLSSDISTGVHQNDGYFTVWRNAGKEICEKFYGRDFSFEEWEDYTLAVNTVCAEVFKDVIEYCRVMRWSKTGVIWWSLIDMWPMLFNYSVIDCEYNKKLPYFWIRQSQQEFALMGVRTENNGEISIYAANDNLYSHTAEYSVTAYDKQGKCRTVATGICSMEANSSGLIRHMPEPKTPELWIIKWNENGREYVNHVFTGKVSYDVMRLWIKIIGSEMDFLEDILELN